MSKIAAVNCVRADVVTRVSRNRTTQCVVTNQVSTGDLIRQLWVWLSEYLCLVGGPYRDRARIDGEIGTNIGNCVVGIRQCFLSNRMRSNTLATCTTKRTVKRVASNQCTRSDGVRQLWVSIAIVLTHRCCRYGNCAIDHGDRCGRRGCLVVVGTLGLGYGNRACCTHTTRSTQRVIGNRATCRTR